MQARTVAPRLWISALCVGPRRSRVRDAFRRSLARTAASADTDSRQQDCPWAPNWADRPGNDRKLEALGAPTRSSERDQSTHYVWGRRGAHVSKINGRVYIVWTSDPADAVNQIVSPGASLLGVRAALGPPIASKRDPIATFLLWYCYEGGMDIDMLHEVVETIKVWSPGFPCRP